MLSIVVNTYPVISADLPADTTILMGDACEVSVTIPLNTLLRDALERGATCVVYLDSVAVARGYTAAPTLDTVADTLTFAARLNQRTTSRTIPSASAVVSADTHTGAADGAIGVFYPVIFGSPGGIGAPSVPAPQALATGDRRLVVTDREVSAIALTLYDTSADPVSSDYRVIDYDRDDLGQVYGYVTFDGSSLTPTTDSAYAVGFDPADGGGPRTAYDVVLTLLTAAGWPIDYARMAHTGAALRGFMLDFFVNTPTNPSDLLNQILPWVSGRLLWSVTGAYVAFEPQILRESSVVADLSDAPIVSPVSRPEAIRGLYTLLYAQLGTSSAYAYSETVGDSVPGTPLIETCPFVEDRATAARIAARKASERTNPAEAYDVAISAERAVKLAPGDTVRTSRGIAKVGKITLGTIATVSVG